MFERPRGGEKALLVRIGLDGPVEQEDLDEFSQLAESAGVQPVRTVTGRRERPDPRFFVGSGKAEEIRQAAEESGADVVLVDRNGFQAMGTTEDVLALGDLEAKFASFGFETLSVDGHDEGAIDAAVRRLWTSITGKPKAIIARTIKGKGVPFMEADNRWHYTRLDERSYAAALQSLEHAEAQP